MLNIDQVHEELSRELYRVYQTPAGFVSAYQSNSDLVLKRMIRALVDHKLQVPYNIKEVLKYWYTQLLTSKADDTEAA